MKVEHGEWTLKLSITRDCEPKEPGATPWNADKICFSLSKNRYDCSFNHECYFINEHGELKSGFGLSKREAYLEKIDGDKENFKNLEYTLIVNVFPDDE